MRRRFLRRDGSGSGLGRRYEKSDGPESVAFLRRVGDSNPRYSNPVRQFSKLVVSATHPTLRSLFRETDLAMRPLAASRCRRGGKSAVPLRFSERVCKYSIFSAKYKASTIKFLFSRLLIGRTVGRGGGVRSAIPDPADWPRGSLRAASWCASAVGARPRWRRPPGFSGTGCGSEPKL